MDWSNETVLSFIGVYEKYQVLWNPKHPDHKSRSALQKAWHDIAKDLNNEFTVEDLRRKKESLMAVYRSIWRKVALSKDTYVPSWFAYSAIDRFISIRRYAPLGVRFHRQMAIRDEEEEKARQQEALKINNQKEVQDKKNESIHEVERDLKSETRREKLKKNPSEKYVNSDLPSSSTMHKKKSYINHYKEPPIKRPKPENDTYETFLTKSQTESSLDGPTLYGQLLISKLKRLSPRNQLILENKIDNLIFEAELSEIDINNKRPANTTFVSADNSSPSSSPASSHSSNDGFVSSPGPFKMLTEGSP